MDNENIITVKNSPLGNSLIEKYLLDHSKNKIYKLTNINYHSDFYLDNNILIINTALYGNQVFERNLETGLFEPTHS